MSTQNQALSALLFLYRDVLGDPLPWIDDIVRVRRPERLPVVLTPEEVHAVLERIRSVSHLVALLLYGSDLRLLECLRLRVNDVDFARLQIAVLDAKGGRDRMTMLPRGRWVYCTSRLCRDAAIGRKFEVVLVLNSELVSKGHVRIVLFKKQFE